MTLQDYLGENFTQQQDESAAALVTAVEQLATDLEVANVDEFVAQVSVYVDNLTIATLARQ